jgi:16S rRNA (cytidine1402-2'-O)-methyltransferase
MTTPIQTPSAPATTPGNLYLVPTPLDFGCGDDALIPIEQTVPTGTLHTAAQLTHWVTENAKSTRAFLKRVNTHTPLQQPIQALHIQELPRELHKKGDFGADNAHKVSVDHLLSPALAGHHMGLVSEAGMPAVADPGALVVRAAHKLGIPVCVLAGPSSLVMALASSGMNGQSFAFVGYLPQAPAERVARIRELDALVQKTGQTQLFIETPYRNEGLMQALLHTLKPSTRLAVACGLALAQDLAKPKSLSVFSAPVAEWASARNRLNWAHPCVFMIGG